MGDATKSQSSKLAKANQHGTPWAAIIIAALGAWQAQAATSKSDDAVKAAKVSKVESAQISETRLKNAYSNIQDTLNKHHDFVDAHESRITDLEEWVVELEGWVEDMVDEDSPNTRREREAREERLAEIRKKKAKRTRDKASFHGRPPPNAAALPDYDAVQAALPAEFE